MCGNATGVRLGMGMRVLTDGWFAGAGGNRNDPGRAEKLCNSAVGAGRRVVDASWASPEGGESK